MLLALVLLDLERNTFCAPISKVTIEAIPVKPRSSQGSLFAPPTPEPESLELTLARLRGVIGSADESGISSVGSPAIVDTHKSDAFGVQAFSTTAIVSCAPSARPKNLRRFRPAVRISVDLASGAPRIVRLWKMPMRVLAAFGPWCSSGSWWNTKLWAREEWDVALQTREGQGFYRICHDRIHRQWHAEGLFD
jgi:protein ImuB